MYEKGAEKYEPWNWIKGGSTDVCAAAMLRHYTAWQEGEDIDPETECHHQLHVAWNALALYMAKDGSRDTDARPKTKPEAARRVRLDNLVILRTNRMRGPSYTKHVLPNGRRVD